MKRGLLDYIYEWTIVGSYTSIGFRHRQRHFNNEVLPNLEKMTALVTGANSGIGYATTLKLAERGVHVIMACRNFERGQSAANQIRAAIPNARLTPALVDISDLTSVSQFSQWLNLHHPRLDILVNNAGVLLPSHQLTPQGHETTFATHVLGPFLLTQNSLPLLAQSPHPHVITVTSGGMYTQHLNLQLLLNSREKFDGVRLYAQAKRAQVILNELWAERHPKNTIRFNTMHPGWASTPGVIKALPRFHKGLQRILRTPEEGADTAVWLASSPEALNHNGVLFLDRAPRKTHVFPWTRESTEDRLSLWNTVESLCKKSLE